MLSIEAWLRRAPAARPWSVARRSARLASFLGLCLLWSPASVWAQPTSVVDLELEDPEAWAMAYFASAALLTSMGVPTETQAGDISLGFEALYIPELDQEQRTVGFGGFKEEDLNRSPVWGRFRLDVGLPANFTLTLGWVPPVRLDGVEANLISVALGRPLISRANWGLGWRLYAQAGEVEGDLTCEADGDLRFPVGSPENPFGCEAPSADTVTLDYWGAQLLAHRRFSGPARPMLYFGLAWNRLDMEFQVNAQTFGFLDRTLLLADGETTALTVGFERRFGDRFQGVLEGVYSDLDVMRPGQDVESDPHWSLRALLSYRVR